MLSLGETFSREEATAVRRGHAVQVGLWVPGDGRCKGVRNGRCGPLTVGRAGDQPETVETVRVAITKARDSHGGDPARVDIPCQEIDKQPPADDEARAAHPAVDDQRATLDGVEDGIRAAAAECVPNERAQ